MEEARTKSDDDKYEKEEEEEDNAMEGGLRRGENDAAETIRRRWCSCCEGKRPKNGGEEMDRRELARQFGNRAA